jgi:hypothetical protein
MYCPQCGTESPSGQHFCRACGANLKVIGKAVALSEAIARSDRGPLPKLKEMMESVKIKQTTEDVTRAFDQMSQEISRGLTTAREQPHPWWMQFKDNRTPEQRREDHISKGAVSLFSGIGVMVFLYYLSAALVLKIPPDKLIGLPFEVEPLVKIMWLVGLIPALTGLGRIIAGLTIKGTQRKSLANEEFSQPRFEDTNQSQPSITGGHGTMEAPMSVAENTTATLDQKIPVRGKR